MTLDNFVRPVGGFLIGVSLKMYFDHRQTVQWCTKVRRQMQARAVPTSRAEVVVLPNFVSLDAAANIFAGTDIRLGAQDIFWEDRGAFTGEVNGGSLRQIGCTYAEIGHAERRRLFGEDPAMCATKAAAALRHGLTPIICVGEAVAGPSSAAIRTCLADLEQICASIVDDEVPARVVVAYEPQWAIGGEKHAPIEYISEVCDAISRWLLAEERLTGSQVIYGGSAGPGLLTDLHDHIDGLFLGRAAHEVDVLDTIIGEAISVTA